jgi:hypothetical protein
MFEYKLNNQFDYEKCYRNQIGGNLNNYYKGLKFQTGYGYFGRFFRRYGIPVFKTLGKEALKTSFDVIKDVSEGVNLKQSIKNRLKERGKSILKNLLEGETSQVGSGRKRKIVTENKNFIVEKRKPNRKNNKKMKCKQQKKSKLSTKKSKTYRKKKARKIVKKSSFKKKRSTNKHLKKKSHKSSKLNFLD